MSINIQTLHRNLFEIFNILKPHIVFLPVAEYTQEFHDFIAEYYKDTQVYLLIDRPIQQEALQKFWKDTQIKLVIDQQYIDAYSSNACVVYDRLYDSDIFFDQKIIRNDKIAVLLSENTEENNKLSEWLYPANSQSPLVLFNNPEFKQPQNIGIFNGPDLNIILNTFSYLIDMDSRFEVESVVCGVPVLDIKQTNNINDKASYVTKTIDIQSASQHSYALFVQEKLIPFLVE